MSQELPHGRSPSLHRAHPVIATASTEAYLDVVAQNRFWNSHTRISSGLLVHGFTSATTAVVLDADDGRVGLEVEGLLCACGGSGGMRRFIVSDLPFTRWTD